MSNSMSPRFLVLISRKGDALGHMLLLNINRKSEMCSPMAPSHLTPSHLERLKSRLGIFSAVGDLYIVYACIILVSIKVS